MILLGYHAMAGAVNGVLNHTQASRAWANYWVNGVKLGEVGQEAIIAGNFGVPIILVTGDSAVCKEAIDLLPEVETVAVKEGLSRICAKIRPPSKCLDLIRNAVKRALARIGEMKPYRIEFQVTVGIEFQITDYADAYERNGWTRINGTTVEKKVKDLQNDFAILY